MAQSPTSASHGSESLNRFRGKPFAFLLYVARDHWWFFAGIALCKLLESVAEIVPSFAYAKLAQWLQSGNLSIIEALSGGAVVLLSYMINETFFSLSMYLNGLRCARTGPRAKTLLLEYALGQSYDFFVRTLSGKTAGRINQIEDSMNEISWDMLTVVVGAGSRLFMVASILLTIHWQLALLFFLWAVVFYHHNIKKMAGIRAANKELSDAGSTTSGQIIDVVSNFQVFFSFGKTKQEVQRIGTYLDREIRAERTVAYQEMRMLLSRCNWFGFLGIILLGGSMSLILEHQLTIPQLSMVFGLWTACAGIEWMNWLIGGLLWHHAKAQEQLTGILEPYTVKEVPNAKTVVAGRSDIAVEGVTFSYPSGSKIFDRLSISIPGGEHIGLVGRSGAGKSTFVALILRYYDPQEGSIRIQGSDIRELKRENHREMISVVPQDPSLFHRSILDNVRFARPSASIEEVQAACRKAHAHEFIEKLPQRYEAMVGEHGVKLSVGQRQRIAIARAILKDAPIVIFDEATSALDSESEQAIHEAIGTLFTEKTLIVIAHRLSTLREMNRIVVFEAGKIVEDGAPEKLLSSDGLYARFWQLQSRGFLEGETRPPYGGSIAEEDVP
jgi:ATP-binding cassette subfamily B protein